VNSAIKVLQGPCRGACPHPPAAHAVGSLPRGHGGGL